LPERLAKPAFRDDVLAEIEAEVELLVVNVRSKISAIDGD